MCGLAGFISDASAGSDEMAVLVAGMANRITHRGPDDSGVWVDAASRIALAHQRLSIPDVSAAGHQPMQSACGRDIEAMDALETQLNTSIGAQMLADVPLGAFLSGGVDSSTVVALMQTQSARPVKTFTIGLEESGYDEASHAKAVAAHLGTDHTEMYIRPEDARAVITRLPTVYCEPFGDSSQIPTFLVSQLARQQVTVALSGDGGDELFGGYNRYLAARQVWGTMQTFPLWSRRAIAGVLRGVSTDTWDAVFKVAKPLLPKRFYFAIPGDKAHKLASVPPLRDDQEFYRQLSSHWSDPASVVIGAKEPITLLTDATGWPVTDCFEH